MTLERLIPGNKLHVYPKSVVLKLGHTLQSSEEMNLQRVWCNCLRCSLSITTFNCDLPKVNPECRQGQECANLKALSEIPPTHKLIEREYLCSWIPSIWNYPTFNYFLPINMTISYGLVRIGNWRKGDLCYVVTGSLVGLSLAGMWKIKCTQRTGQSNLRYLQAECLKYLQEMWREIH